MQLAQSLLHHSASRLLTNKAVTRIEATEAGTYDVTAGDQRQTYDVVILATPSLGAHIQSAQMPTQRPYHTTHVTFLVGAVNPAYFGGASTVPDMILTTAGANDVMSVTAMHASTHPGMDVYKIFSSVALGNERLSNIFSPIELATVQRRVWAAYPEYGPSMGDAPFVLAPGLYHVNAIEEAASAIEMSAIGAKNVALLASEHIQQMAALEQSRTDAIKAQRTEL